jgi:ketosteroid isomerase-like protein
MLRIKYFGATILCLSLWAGSLAAQTSAQKQRVEQLYAENADAWSRHDIAKIVSFFDPACVFLGPGGLRIFSYAEWRKNLPATLAQERHNQVKITLKAVKDVENGFVASIERQDSYDIYDPKRSAWIPMLLSSPQENTWRSDGRGNFKVVLTKFLSVETPSPVVVQSGGYQLTEEMIQRALQLAQIEAGADFSSSDAAALRADFIALFQKEPAKQTEAYKNVAEWLQQAPLLADGKRTWAQMASLRDNIWQALGQNQQVFREFQSYPMGKMVLKYNPVLVNSGGTIITKAHVNSLLFSNDLVAQIAGVPPYTQAEEDQYIRTFPAQFGSLTKEQKEAFRLANVRMAMFVTIYSQTRSTRGVMIAAIRRNVHSSRDVPNEARRVENSSVNGDYFNASLIEGALNVSTMSMGLDAMRRQFLRP